MGDHDVDGTDDVVPASVRHSEGAARRQQRRHVRLPRVLRHERGPQRGPRLDRDPPARCRMNHAADPFGGISDAESVQPLPRRPHGVAAGGRRRELGSRDRPVLAGRHALVRTPACDPQRLGGQRGSAEGEHNDAAPDGSGHGVETSLPKPLRVMSPHTWRRFHTVTNALSRHHTVHWRYPKFSSDAYSSSRNRSPKRR